ncbi:MAG: hypothetical protein R3C39_13115 [Dehalococcoidia bacterium]
MLSLLRSPLHHSEAIDPTLIAWIRDEIDHLLGLDPSTIVAILGLAIIAFPLWLGISASRQRARMEPDTSADRRAS